MCSLVRRSSSSSKQRTTERRRWVGISALLSRWFADCRVYNQPFDSRGMTPSNRKLEGKVALVSGAGRGIGRAVAIKLASEGARVVVNDLDDDPAAETIELIRAISGEAVACVGSVTATDFGERFVKTALDSFDGIDIIVNN